jgi:mediator of RNA polymerase II transcription subunit 12
VSYDPILRAITFSLSQKLKDGTNVNLIQGRFGYHFPYPGQEEDILTEANVKDGLHLPTPVAVRVFLLLHFPKGRCPIELAGQAETWGALETFRRRSKESDTTAELEDLMNQIFARRADAVIIPYVSFISFQRFLI